MKRWFSLLLALVLACMHLPGPLAPAFAEEESFDASLNEAVEVLEAVEEELPEDVEAAVEAEEDEALPEEELQGEVELDVEEIEASSEELVLGLDDVIDGAAGEEESIEEEPTDEEGAEQPEEGACAAEYDRTAGEASVLAEQNDDAPIAWVAGDAVVLRVGAGDGFVRVAFDTAAGVVEGWVESGLLIPLTAEETAAYLDAAAGNGPVSLYDDDPNMPLVLADCRFAEPAEEEAPAPEEEPAAEEDPVNEPAPEEFPAEEPAPEETPVDEPTPEEQPAQDEPEEPEAPAEEVNEPEAPETPSEAEDEVPETPAVAAAGDMITFAEPAFTLSRASVELAVGETWTVEARDAEGSPIAPEKLGFTNDGNNVSVDAASGGITAVAPGKARVGVSYNNETQYVTVTVLSRPLTVALEPSAVVIGAGQTSPLTVSFPGGTGALYTFASSNSAVAYVDGNDIVGRAEGTAVITVVVSDTVQASCAVTVEKAPEHVTLSAKSLLMGAGDSSYHLTAQVSQGAHEEPLTWDSSKPDVVSVDAEGKLTAIKASAKAVTITATAYNGIAGACSVVVANAPAKVSLTSSVTLYKGQKLTPSYSVLDANNSSAASVARMQFTSSNSSVVTVDADGKLTATGVGSATVTATAYNDVKAEMSVTVRPAVTALNLAPKTRPTSGYLGVGQTMSGWNIACKPNNAYAYTYTYSSSNSSVLKILDAKTGKFKALKKGTAYIRVASANGVIGQYKFTVRKAPGKITFGPSSGKLRVGKTGRYSVNLHGAGGSFTFKSSKPMVATVDAYGRVRALKAGTTKITLKTYNGKKKTVKLRVYNKSYAGMPNYLVSNVSSYHAGMSKEEKLEYVIYVAQNKLGCRYVWGSFGPSTFDCSGFTYYCFSKIGVRMQNSAYRQGYLGGFKKIKKVGALRRGDLVCFDTSRDGDRSDHVGIYLGNGYFIHSSSSAHKVIISQFKSRSSNYYQRRFSWGRRILA